MSKFKFIIITTAIIFSTIVPTTAKNTAEGDSTFIKRLQEDGQVKIDMPETLELRLLPGSYQAPTKSSSSTSSSNSNNGGSYSNNKGVVRFRIQALIDNNENAKKACTARARSITSRFPELGSRLEYRSPGWRVLVGEFSNLESAKKMLAQLKQTFPSYAKDLIIVKASR